MPGRQQAQLGDQPQFPGFSDACWILQAQFHRPGLQTPGAWFLPQPVLRKGIVPSPAQ